MQNNYFSPAKTSRRESTVLRNHFLLAFRSLLKNRIYSIINLIGLSAGISAFIFICLYIQHEKSYDQFHINKDRIFRVQQDRTNQGEVITKTVAGCFAAGPDLKESFPEVERYVRITLASPVLLYKGEGFKEEHAGYVSEDFFRIFSFKLIRGIDSTVLNNPYNAVISQSAAKRIFKGEDPLGKVVSYKGRYDVEVTGVFEDMPENSHMKLDVLISMATFEMLVNKFVLEEPWRWDNFLTYVLLKENTEARALEEKLPRLIEEKTGAWLKETNQQMELHLQPLTSIHLHSNFGGEFEPNGSDKNVHYLTAVALFIIIIAWLNYISLATAKSMERAKEVGVRKVLGGYRTQLMGQFITESLLLNLTAAAFALLMMYLTLPYFKSLTGWQISPSLLSINFWKWMLIIILAGSFISGLYPAFVLSAFKPAIVLKGKFTGSSSGRFLRKGMVLIPFVTAILLVSCLFIIFKQISLLRNQSLGFDLKQKLVVRDSEIYDSLFDSRLTTFKKELLRIPGIEKMTYVSAVPGHPIPYFANSVRRLKADETEVNQYKFFTVDENFVEVFGLHMLTGRNFTAESTPQKVVLVNSLASKTLGFSKPEEAIDEKIIFRDDTVTIVGVVNDYHHESPKNSILPVIYVFNPDGGFFFFIPLQTSSANAIVEKVQELFATVYAGQPFSYFFLDDQYDRQYKADVQFGKVVGVFSTLLIIVTTLGLFGLSAYTASVRTKEIGIRKVLGANINQVVLLLCREYLILIGIAIAIAVPCAWYVMKLWLNSFSTKIQITPWLFIAPSVLVIVITFVTISFQTIKAALTNPVDTLKHE